ncbi:hypothetical protein [Parasediminibacterium sp. JCM 36343]|uniref:5'-methylthioadenosine/S-adenosylhomocysteine nucleosidase family protein n=1 Tax=Parasediminibacterium sp. JCM 36343 TaxID=3374279 RepID=UPI00397905F7
MSINIQYEEKGIIYFTNQKDLFKLLLVTATKIEKDILHGKLKPLPGCDSLIKIYDGKQSYYLGLFGQYRAVHVACGEMGSIGRESSIITTTDAIAFCSPAVVLMPGIAFGIDKKKQKIGDVLVSERIISYEPQRIGESNTEFRGKESPASSLLINRFRNTDWNYKIGDIETKIFIGDVLSGEKLMDNTQAKNVLVKQYPGSKGGEMEGVGIASACDGKVAHWIVVKAICDFADGQKKYGKAKKQATAANSAINLCEYIFNSNHAFSEILEPYDEQIGSAKLTAKLFEITKRQIEDAN